MNKKVDILLAAYNGEKYIGEQINSIINQTYENWNLIIRDDGSLDNTKEIIRKFSKKDRRIIIIEDNKGNLGFVKNFEELLKYSFEDYIFFSDQDDVWFNYKIEKLYKKAESMTPNIPLLIHCNASVCNKNLKILKKKFIKSVEAKKNNYFFSFIVQGSSSMINRKLLEISLPFFKKVYVHDRYFHLLAELFGKRIFIDESLMYYRQHDNNQIGSKSSIVNKLINKKYFDLKDRNLIIELYTKNIKKIEKRKIFYIEKYIDITDRKLNRLERLFISYKSQIYMDIKKKFFLLLKG